MSLDEIISVTDGAVRKKRERPAHTLNYMVGIGASAGGLQALRPLVATLKKTGQSAYIVAQHTAPQHESILTDLLMREASLSVVTAVNGQRILPDHIYVTPPNKDVQVHKGKLVLRPAGSTGPKPSIDVLYASLAEEYGERAVAVVLSGTGSDGTHGCRAIKSAGGIVLTQDPRNAAHDGMPASVQRAGLSDAQLPVEGIAARLNELTAENRGDDIAGEVADENSLPGFRFLLDLVFRTTHVDFSQYKEATLIRQMQRRIKAVGVPGLAQYIRFVKDNPDEITRLQESFLISVTSFFRDPAVFAALSDVLREIASAKSTGEAIRIWIPGCATGEEVYSIAIILAEILGPSASDTAVKIFATDIDQHALDIARQGIYPLTALGNVDANLKDRYFSIEGHHVRVCKLIRDMCIFSRQDLVRDPPFLRMDFIACRNLLIYFRQSLQEETLTKLHYSLNSHGVVLLGRSESLVPGTKSLFSTIDSRYRIYRKRHSATGRVRLPKIQPFTIAPQGGEALVTINRAKTTSDLMHEELLKVYAPASILVSPSYEPLRFFGNAKRFLQIPDGVADFSILSICPPALRVELRTLLQRVEHDSSPDVVGFPIELTVDGTELRLRVRVRAVSGAVESERALLVCFEELPPLPVLGALIAADDEGVSRDETAVLKQELLGTREHLQAVMEEMHTSNEELQSVNEELQSATEELQASNEELQTTNEELHATNEELTTLNDELQARSTELTNLNDTLLNIQNSMQVGMVLVDRHMRVTRYTPLAVRIFGLLPGDIGQSLLGLPSYLHLPRLREHFDHVIENVETVTEHVHVGDTHYLMQISPYLSEIGQCNGAILSFTDVSELRRVEKTLFDQERRFRTIYESAPTSIWQVDWSAAFDLVADLKEQGIADYTAYFRENAPIVEAALKSVKVVDVNSWTLTLVEATTKDEVLKGLADVFAGEEGRTDFAALLSAFALGRHGFHAELRLRTLHGDHLNAMVSLVFPRERDELLLLTISNLSDLRRAEFALEESEERFDLLLRTMTSAVLIVAGDGRIVRTNPVAQRTFGYTQSEFETMRIEDIVPEAVREHHQQLRTAYGAKPRPRAMGGGAIFKARRRDGTLIETEISLAPIRIQGQQFIVAKAVDITERLRVERELHVRDEQYRMVVETTPDGFIMADMQGAIIETNQAYLSRFDYTPEQLTSFNLRDLILEEDKDAWQRRIQDIVSTRGARFEASHRMKSGHHLPIEVSLSYSDNNGGRLFAFIRDISARRRAEEEIANLAYYDFLTGLPNRRTLLDRIRQAMAVSHRTGHYGALLFVDIDNFKLLNDTLGHEKGDVVLAEVARRLKAQVRAGDTVARFGGDEFVVMLEGLMQNRDVAALQAEVTGSRIIHGLSQPYELDSREYHCTPSIGVSLFHRHETTVDDLLKQTDLAMYQAKASGRNAMRFFDAQMQASIDARAHLEAELRKAIQDNDLVLYYQPQVDQTGAIIGVEALLRWMHHELGMVMPGSFIPVAEGTSLILLLGQRVLQQACETLARWSKVPATRDIVMSVNVSARQFRAHDFISTVRRALETTGAPPANLQLELTESLLVDDLGDTSAKMTDLQSMGVRFSLDDFGTGYSSLSYLKRLPLDQLKIDRAFVADMLTNHNDAAIVRALIALGNSLDLNVIAEGVETKEQWDFIVGEGCHGGQGYLFGKPMPLPEFEDMIHFGVQV